MTPVLMLAPVLPRSKIPSLAAWKVISWGLALAPKRCPATPMSSDCTRARGTEVMDTMHWVTQLYRLISWRIWETELAEVSRSMR